MCAYYNKEGGQHEDLSVEEAKKDVYNVRELKPPFIKVEDMSKKYRPLVRESIKKWPMCVEEYIKCYFMEED